VDERCSVDQLDGDCRRGQLNKVVRATLRGQEHERRADALAPRREQVRHRRGHHVGVALDQAPEAGFNCLEVSRDWTEDGVRIRL